MWRRWQQQQRFERNEQWWRELLLLVALERRRGRHFVLGAEAACTSASKQIDALGTPQQAQVLGYLEKTEDVIEELHEEIEALGGGSEAESAYTEALGKAVIVLNHMTNAARSENFDAVRELSDELVALKVGKLAEAAELKACAAVPGASA